HDQDLQAEAESTTAQVQDHLLIGLEQATEVARSVRRLAVAFDLAPSIAAGGSPRLDAVVDAVAGDHPRVMAYVLDSAGKVVATSNRARPDSIAGKVYEARPYFRDAVAGGEGRFIGVGVTTGRAGFYASAPIADATGRVVGVSVVKQDLDRESFGPLGTGTSFLVGGDGQVLLAAVDEFAGRPMWPQDGAARPGTLLPGPWSGATWARIDGARYVAVRAPLPAQGWSVVTFRRELLRGTNRLLGILITLTLSTAIVASFVLLQRQLGTESQLAQKKREAEGRAREMARRADTDALTGIANRQGFNEAMAREFARSRRFRHPLSIVLVDLDHFKRVNDEHGHAVGDQVLAGTARLLATRVRESDFVARWGGEEFAVIASMTDAAGAARLAEKLRDRLEATRLGPDGGVTASFGVAEMRPDDTVQTMVRRADEALYAAKDGGRNRVCCGEAWVDMAIIAMAESGVRRGAEDDGEPLYAETGSPELDAEHRELSGALSEFVSLVDVGDAAAVRPAMAGLIDLVAGHFGHEEELMRRRAYPPRSRHEEAHMLFVADARRFQVELERDGVTPAFRQWAGTRLPEWFRYHILAHDVALGRFLSRAPHSISKAR
ncbi:MAG TPA: diguanylate cyclase, partial [Anaeromyxobacteraceae bacterium]|nr:diguanylate cyclase [Anaeromyxobacteraceae bacterium]